ncbi:MAG: sugar transferase [Ferruginibacter sp.]
MLTTTRENAPDLNEDPTITHKPQIQFLFIKSIDLQNSPLLQFYQDSNFVDSFATGKTYLKNNNNTAALPDLIVIDIPLNFAELTSFQKWIAENFNPPIPIVYNEGVLTQNEIQKLYKLKLLDDVVNIDYNSTVLYYKAKFFKKRSTQLSIDSSKKDNPVKQFTSNKVSLAKRTLDIIVSLIAIIILLPVFLIIILLIKLETKGPGIYKSKRAGKGFKIFDFYKFRTMVVGADSKIEELYNLNIYGTTEGTPSFFKIANDPRITKVGTFLRNTSLDELPQLINVLKGDMSLVGNRPLPLYEAATLTTNEWAERFMAPAGITGLWQVKKRGQKEMSPAERVELDINYARNHNLARDFWIIAKTPSALFQKENV